MRGHDLCRPALDRAGAGCECGEKATAPTPVSWQRCAMDRRRRSPYEHRQQIGLYVATSTAHCDAVTSAPHVGRHARSHETLTGVARGRMGAPMAGAQLAMTGLGSRSPDFASDSRATGPASCRCSSVVQCSRGSRPAAIAARTWAAAAACSSGAAIPSNRSRSATAPAWSPRLALIAARNT